MLQEKLKGWVIIQAKNLSTMAVLCQDQARFYLDLVLLITKVLSSLLPHPSPQVQLLLFSLTKKITTILSLAHSKKTDD